MEKFLGEHGHAHRQTGRANRLEHRPVSPVRPRARPEEPPTCQEASSTNDFPVSVGLVRRAQSYSVLWKANQSSGQAGGKRRRDWIDVFQWPGGRKRTHYFDLHRWGVKAFVFAVTARAKMPLTRLPRSCPPGQTERTGRLTQPVRRSAAFQALSVNFRAAVLSAANKLAL